MRAQVLPAGTVTFLFTDIEGSTRLVQQLGDETYGQLQETHRRIVRAAIAAHRGVELRTEGDSFFVAFSDADDALAAAVEAQAALAKQSWSPATIRVRIGLHTGRATPVGHDYTGYAVNQGARICSAAHGGQVVVSVYTANATHRLPSGVKLRSLGKHRLKDLAAPLELFQVCHPQLDAAFPPLRSLETVAHNLPVQTSTFIGREAELREVRGLIQGARLVTLTGPGGTGKTRLAYQVVTELVDSFPDGVWVVELAPVSEPGLVAQAVAAAQGVREQPGWGLTQTLVSHLRTRASLLILDNCEHLVEEAAELVLSLLQGCPRLRVMATSREPLRVAGEITYAVPGLSTAAIDAAAREDAGGSDAVRLFIARATDANSAFAITPEALRAAEGICARLDGLPLAIELAAARARTLSLQRIASHMGSALDLLTKGPRGADPRQATLRGAIEWSYRLLDETERLLFRRLAVFAGGWGLDAAATVCGGGGLPPHGLLDALDALVDKSLVAASDDAGEKRFHLLETIRAYALDTLEQSGEGPALRGRHAAWCLRLAEEARATPAESVEEATRFDVLETEHANLLAALEHLGRAADPAELDLAVALGGFWVRRAHWRIGYDHLSRALSAHPGSAAVHGRAARAVGVICTQLARHGEARERLREALVVARHESDALDEERALGNLGHVASKLGDYAEGSALLEEALAISRAIGDRRDEARWLAALGTLAQWRGEPAPARQYYEMSLEIARELGNTRLAGRCVGNLGVIHLEVLEHHQARDRFEEALAIARELGDRSSEGIWLANLGSIAARLGEPGQCAALYDKALAVARELGDRRIEGECLANLGALAHGQNDFAAARERYREARELAQAIGDRRQERWALSVLAEIEWEQGKRAPAIALLVETLEMDADLDAPAESITSLSLCAAILDAAGDSMKAVPLLAWAAYHRDREGLPSADGDPSRGLLERARERHSASEYDQAWRDGQGLSHAEVLRRARDHLGALGPVHS